MKLYEFIISRRRNALTNFKFKTKYKKVEGDQTRLIYDYHFLGWKFWQSKKKIWVKSLKRSFYWIAER